MSTSPASLRRRRRPSAFSRRTGARRPRRPAVVEFIGATHSWRSTSPASANTGACSPLGSGERSSSQPSSSTKRQRPRRKSRRQPMKSRQPFRKTIGRWRLCHQRSGTGKDGRAARFWSAAVRPWTVADCRGPDCGHEAATEPRPLGRRPSAVTRSGGWNSRCIDVPGPHDSRDVYMALNFVCSHWQARDHGAGLGNPETRA